jgi:hypothetical protein
MVYLVIGGFILLALSMFIGAIIKSMSDDPRIQLQSPLSIGFGVLLFLLGGLVVLIILWVILDWLKH